MIRGFLIIIAFSVTSQIIIQGQNLEFYREDIVFTFDGNSIVTEAEYHFCNVGNKDISITLLYPFPEGTIDLIDSLSIRELGSETVIPYYRSGSGVRLGIKVPSYGQKAFRVYYRQLLDSGHFTYILTSTASWRRPLEMANYYLRIPVEMAADSLSYPQDTVYLRDNFWNFEWKKKDFMPERDFEVFFHSEKEY